MDEVVYSMEKWPLLLDPTGDAARFLKYQRGSFLLGYSPADMEQEKLRRLLVGALSAGSNMTIRYRTLEGVSDLSRHFSEGCFPPAVLSKRGMLEEENWGKLLRPEEGEKSPHEFVALDGFCLVVVTETENYPPECLEYFHPILVSASSSSGPSGEEPDAVASMYGAKEIVKNSTDLVEAGFDGDLPAIQLLADKGYHMDSEDGRGHTALSEAASQVRERRVLFLLFFLLSSRALLLSLSLVYPSFSPFFLPLLLSC